MIFSRLLAWTVLAFAPVVAGQQIGKTPEVHPKLTTQTCTTEHGCVSQGTSVVLDAQWRDIDDIQTGTSCITAGGELNKTICPTAEECARNCALSGADYTGAGVEAKDDSMTLHMFHRYHGKLWTVSPQVYLLDSNGKDYSIMKLLNQEVSFDVDVSNLPCGMNGAMYLTAMDASGGRSKLNPAGAAYGTGYCDSQCYNGYPFLNGVANVDTLGACCNEMDLIESNSRGIQTTSHPCNITGSYPCSGSECHGKDRVCDPSGCGFNPYRRGAHTFYGLGGRYMIDTKKPFRVITQFPTDDGTDHGTLTEIRRLYIQDGNLIHNAAITTHDETFDSITSAYCKATYAKSFEPHGGLAQMGEALKRGMVLVMGLWDDSGDRNYWLDGGSSGPCTWKEGKPAVIKANDSATSITYSSIRWGEIGSTFEV